MGLRPASPLSPTPRSHLEPAGCSARWPRGRRRAPPARRRVFTAQLGQTDKGPDGVRCEECGGTCQAAMGTGRGWCSNREQEDSP